MEGVGKDEAGGMGGEGMGGEGCGVGVDAWAGKK